MYEAFYHLQAKPFQLSADPRFFYSSKGHRRAMAYLVYGAHQGEGFIVITGEIGAGKTMLAATLAHHVASRNLVLAKVVSTNLEADDMVRMVAASFGLPQENSKSALLNAVEQFLLACHRQGKRALLVVDEAQNLPARSVEELRMLSNFVSADKPLLQTFLLGQEFRKRWRARQWSNSGSESFPPLGPMSETDTAAYILHRLKTVGWHQDPSFSREAFAAIHQYTGGIPRKINIFCDRLLLLSRLDEKHAITVNAVAVVVNELQQEFAPAALHAGQKEEA
jgi:putative secretion ATPase (PEP-CTERM system associated)